MSTIVAFVIGGLVGAGIALLMAPQAGDETRSLIRDKGVEIKERAVDAVENTRSKAEDAVSHLADTTRDRIQSVRP